MGLARIVSLLIALFVVFCLHVGVNIVNRVLMELFCSPDNDSLLNCSFLVFIVLFFLLSIRPCNFGRYSYCLVCAEILLQLLYFAWCLNFQFLLVCDVLPYLDKYWFGKLPIYKFLLLLLIIYIIWFHVFAVVELKVNWGGDDDCEDSDNTCDNENTCDNSCSDTGPMCCKPCTPRCSPRPSGDCC
ncbi:hypothetical protein WDU94_001142 [Cyamophila willieti]